MYTIHVVNLKTSRKINTIITTKRIQQNFIIYYIKIFSFFFFYRTSNIIIIACIYYSRKLIKRINHLGGEGESGFHFYSCPPTSIFLCEISRKKGFKFS